jgi:hypothetical protein
LLGRNYQCIELFKIIQKKRISKHRKPKSIRFLNYTNLKILKISQENKFLLYSPCRNSNNSKLGTNVTWLDAYYQEDDDIYKINLFSTTKCHIQI